MTSIIKTYSGTQTRLLLPRKQDIAGVIGDSHATTIYFKIPNTYDTGWTKFIEFDCQIYDSTTDTYIQPQYVLASDDSFTIPAEITSQNVGKEISYDLKFVSTTDDTLIEKSAQGSLYFYDSANGTETTDPDVPDLVVYLILHALVNATFSIDTATSRPTLTFAHTEANPTDLVVPLEVPYLTNGKIDPQFLDSQYIVSLFNITSPSALTSLTSANVPDWALVTEGEHEGDLYLLTASDPTVLANWLLVRSDNPVFNSITAVNVGFVGTITTALANAVLITDADGVIKASSASVTDLSNLSGTTSNVQSQINAEVSARTSADANLQAQTDVISALVTRLNNRIKFVQSSASGTWDIVHNLGHEPTVQVYDTGGNLILTAINQVSDNETIINVTPSMAGYAILR